jgi:putative transcriptional regulator
MSAAFDEMMQGLSEVDGFLAGEKAGFRVHVPDSIDVKHIRTQLHMTQAKFSSSFGFSLDAIKHWEGGRRNPEVSARAYLTVISRNPEAVMRALGEKSKTRTSKSRRVDKVLPKARLLNGSAKRMRTAEA